MGDHGSNSGGRCSCWWHARYRSIAAANLPGVAGGKFNQTVFRFVRLDHRKFAMERRLLMMPTIICLVILALATIKT